MIELMIALVIVGVLAAIALPSYVQEYMTRAKVGEGVMLAKPLKLAIGESFQFGGPRDMQCVDAATCSTLGTYWALPSKNIASVSSDSSGVIRIKYQPSVLPAGRDTLAVAPAFPSGTPIDLSDPAAAGTLFVWDCGMASATPGVAGAAAGQTTVPAYFLPAGCK